MSDKNDRTAYLDLDTKDETFLDATELVLNMGPRHPSTTKACSSHPQA